MHFIRPEMFEVISLAYCTLHIYKYLKFGIHVDIVLEIFNVLFTFKTASLAAS